MRFLQALLAGALALALAANAAAQTTYYVDPVNGLDTNNGLFAVTGTPPDGPFQTVTKALSVIGLVPGDTIELLPGTYSVASNGETFPLAPVDGVDIVYPGSGNAAVFDGNGAASVFRISNSLTAGAQELRGFRVTDCATAFSIPNGVDTTLLVIEDMIVDGITVSGVDADYTDNGNQSIVVRNCQITGQGGGGAHGVRIRVTNLLTNLATSLIEDCTITNFSVGVSVEAYNGAVVLSNSQVRRNSIHDFSTAGIHVLADGGASAGATNSLSVNGNDASNETLGTGLLIESVFGNGGSTRTNGAINYNRFANNGTNVHLRTSSNTAAVADLTNSFTGNVIIGATNGNGTGNGVFFDVVLPPPLQSNCDPDFGNPDAIVGRNTLQANSPFDMQLDADMQNQIEAESNFWGQVTLGGVLSRIDNPGGAPTPLVSPFFFNTLQGGAQPKKIASQTAVDIQVNAGANSAFVDNADAASAVAQMIVTVREVGAVASTLVEPNVFADGSGFLFTSPKLKSGKYRIDIVLPGNQTASISLTVEGGGSGGGSSSATGICVVATAAHGDYDAPEVRTLRRLRDDYFLTHPVGESFTRAYYEHGPPVAEWIDERAWARTATRAALAPVVTVSSALLQWNAGQRFAFAVLLLGLSFTLRRRR